jgi:hypothetical protein
MGYTVGKGRPPKHSQFRPGRSGNPDGGRRHNPALKIIKRLTAPEIQEVGSLIVKGSMADLKKAAADPGASVYKVMLISLVMRVIKKGDPRAFDTLFNRLVGKPKSASELTGAEYGLKNFATVVITR